jgi:glycosyltransferase involved in cell wall biosynthesis
MKPRNAAAGKEPVRARRLREHSLTQRVLVISHGHPAFSKGGAEIAAYQLYQALRRRRDCDAWFIARHGILGLARPGSAFALRDTEGREILYQQDTDYFDFSAVHLRYLVQDLAALVAELRPDVVHLHHYIYLGIETLRLLRNVMPPARIILSLHEFLAICNRQGQMVKSDGRLCLRARPQDCHLCMPERSPPDYFLRERYIKGFLALVDRFIAPSQFLKQRYVEWGLPPDRISVIENGQPPTLPAPWRPGDGKPDSVFGYFGQITPYKGLDILLKAFNLLPVQARERCRLEIHGGVPDISAPDFSRTIDRALESAPPQVHYAGAYAPEDLPTRMAGLDWVVVPSIWWENSPLVIQEAFAHRRPVICSNIGGMAEKVADGKNGLQFRVGDAASLADKLMLAVTKDGLLDELRAGITPPPTIDDSAEACLRAYAQ